MKYKLISLILILAVLALTALPTSADDLTPTSRPEMKPVTATATAKSQVPRVTITAVPYPAPYPTPAPSLEPESSGISKLIYLISKFWRSE